jgi:hypothetical protein
MGDRNARTHGGRSDEAKEAATFDDWLDRSALLQISTQAAFSMARQLTSSSAPQGHFAHGKTPWAILGVDIESGHHPTAMAAPTSDLSALRQEERVFAEQGYLLSSRPHVGGKRTLGRRAASGPIPDGPLLGRSRS